MAFLTDSLRSAFAAINPFGRRDASIVSSAFTHELAFAAYMSSGMLRKVITIPADDRVREWRDWQAEKEQIELLEKEEARLGLIAKTKHAEILRGIGGGAMILITAGGHETELNADTIKQGGLIAVNVVSRWQIKALDFVTDLASPDYGSPRWFEVSGDGKSTKLHPSRVVCFCGDRLPAGAAVSLEEAFWGDTRLLRVYNEVQISDNAQAWFAALVRKAKLLRIGIPDLDSMDPERLNKRVEVIALGESSLNATVYRSKGGPDDGGEEVGDYQITWTGIPAMMDAFDQRVAAVSDIPFTRLMGRSPAGMNATGKSDDDNWNKMVVSGQKLETRPCLEKLDPILIRSAGVDPAKATWRFAPLSTPSEQEEAETFDKTMDAVVKLQNTGAIPDEAFAKGLQNLMEEREYMPGLGQALAEIPEDERFAINSGEPEIDPATGQPVDPSAIVKPPRTAAKGVIDARGSITTDELLEYIAKLRQEDEQSHPFEDGARSRRRGLKGSGKGRGWSEGDHPRGRGGKFTTKSGSSLSSQRAAIRAHVNRVFANPGVHRVVDIGEAKGSGFAGFRRALDTSGVNHVRKSHGDVAREAGRVRPQAAIGKRDFQAIPRIVASSPHPVHSGTLKGAKGLRLIYTAKVGGFHYEYTEIVNPRRKQVVIKSLRKWR